jgi:uncharacterized membrane protein
VRKENPVAAAKTDHTLERLVFFSDAVFAIAITLLVIEIHAPDLPRTATDAEHWAALKHLGPSFAGYLISFALVGAFWMSHHRYFALAARYRPRILGWNMALLATIAFMPFTTAYLSANMDQRVPTLVYCGMLFLASSFNMIVSLIATSPPMVDEAASAEDIRKVRVRGLTLVLGFATAFLLALLLDVGQYGLLSLPFFRILLARIGKVWGARAAAAGQDAG